MKTSTWEVLETLGPENPEQAYRRGYADGWVKAIDEIHDLMFKAGMSRQDAYDAAYEHWQQALLDWVHRANSKIEYAPELKPSPPGPKSALG